MECKLVWNVYKKEWNENKIGIFNIFEHSLFWEEIQKLKKKYKKDNSINLKEKVRIYLFYFFGSKYEYETTLTNFPAYIDKEEVDKIKKSESKYCENIDLQVKKKVDVYEQVRMNYDIFFDYLCREYLLK